MSYSSLYDSKEEESKKSNEEMSSPENIVASHYNARMNYDENFRMSSSVSHLRTYNNWVKSILIRRYVKPDDIVFDMGGGKGGDLKKFKYAKIRHLVISDIAEVSIQHAHERYMGIRDIKFTCDFIVADSSKTNMRKALDKLVDYFDVVSCQFSLHYCFDTVERAKTAIENASYKLRPGGYFILTIPDSDYIVNQVRNSSDQKSIGNRLYSIEFEKANSFPNYGAKYNFFLQDSVENVPEYIIHIPTLIELAKLSNMELVLKKNFHQMYDECRQDEINLMYNMVDFEEDGSFPESNWEIARLYLAVVFQKKKDNSFIKDDSILSSRNLIPGKAQISNEDDNI